MNQKLQAFVDGNLRSWAVSQAYSLWAMFVFGVGLEFSRGNITDFRSLYLFVSGPSFWFGIFMAVIFGIGPLARARQGAQRVSTTPPAPPEKAP